MRSATYFVVLLLQGGVVVNTIIYYEKSLVVYRARAPMLCRGTYGVVCSKYIYSGVVSDPATLLTHSAEYRLSNSLVNPILAYGTLVRCSYRAWRYEFGKVVAVAIVGKLFMERLLLLDALASCRTYTDTAA